MCRFGADTEDIYRLMTGLPGFPITITATYHHLKCFACLLLHGAKPDLNDLEKLGLPPYVQTQCSVPHAIIKYRLENWLNLGQFCMILRDSVRFSVI